jgi:hypothetical protein
MAQYSEPTESTSHGLTRFFKIRLILSSHLLLVPEHVAVLLNCSGYTAYHEMRWEYDRKWLVETDWKDMVVGYLNVLLWHSRGQTKEKPRSSSVQIVDNAIEQSTFRIQIEIITGTSVFLLKFPLTKLSGFIRFRIN